MAQSRPRARGGLQIIDVNVRASAGIVVLGCVLAGCAAKPHPVLYPNAQLQRVGPEVAERDIEECESVAQAYVSSGGATGKVAESAAIGAGAGAAIVGAGGAAAGAVVGHPRRGAATGAAFGGAAGFMRGLFRGPARSSGPSPVYKKFVNHCLHERGYQPIG